MEYLTIVLVVVCVICLIALLTTSSNKPNTEIEHTFDDTITSKEKQLVTRNKPSLNNNYLTKSVTYMRMNTGKAMKTLTSSVKKVVPVSVNYHFTRQCNYTCGFCFHTAKSSFVLPLEDAKRGLKMMKDAGMEKINFSGGEPFIEKRGTHVGEMVRYCKETLDLASVSIVTNGSLVKEKWFTKYGKYLDILAVSCDSFDPDTNASIGRQHGSRNHLDSLRKVRQLCTTYKVAFKLNTVVNTYNKMENMCHEIAELDPVRWKVFQCLLIDEENSGPTSIRHAEGFVVTADEFHTFIDRHKDIACLVPESNEKMQNSYLILDECMRFLDCTKGSKEPSRSILDVGVENALLFSGFDEKMFFKRGGKYSWSKADMQLDW